MSWISTKTADPSAGLDGCSGSIYRRVVVDSRTISTVAECCCSLQMLVHLIPVRNGRCVSIINFDVHSTGHTPILCNYLENQADCRDLVPWKVGGPAEVSSESPVPNAKELRSPRPIVYQEVCLYPHSSDRLDSIGHHNSMPVSHTFASAIVMLHHCEELSLRYGR